MISFHFSLQSLLPTQTSANISVTRSSCSTHLSAVLQAEGEQRGGLTLHLTCQPNLNLKASVQHSIEAMKTLGFPTRGGITLNVSTAHVPGVEADLELGRCFFRGRLGKTKSPQREEERSSYVVNVTNFCPALQVQQSEYSHTSKPYQHAQIARIFITSSRGKTFFFYHSVKIFTRQHSFNAFYCPLAHQTTTHLLNQQRSIRQYLFIPLRKFSCLTKTHSQYRHRQGHTNIKTKNIKVPMLDQ